MKGLPPKRTEVLEAVKALQREKGARPTYREIAERCNIASETARDHIRELIVKGIIRDNIKNTELLSKYQEDTLLFICKNKLLVGRAPGLKEIGAYIGVKNLSLVRRILMGLQRKGYIEKPHRKKFAIKVKKIPDEMVGKLVEIQKKRAND